MDLKLELHGNQEIDKFLTTFPRKELPFAVALALTRTAQAIQEAEMNNISDKFTVRGTWLRKGGRFGVGITPATKHNLMAVVESRAPWLFQHEEGGERDPRHLHRYSPTQNIRRTGKELIKKAERPGAVRAEGKRGFIIKTRSGLELLMIRRRRGEHGVEPLYRMILHARIKADMGFEETGRSTVARVWMKNLMAAAQQAVATARP